MARNGSGGPALPDHWDHMGSSERDLWVERHGWPDAQIEVFAGALRPGDRIYVHGLGDEQTIATITRVDDNRPWWKVESTDGDSFALGLNELVRANKSPQLRVVYPEPKPADTPTNEITPKQAAAFAELVASDDAAAVERTMAAMSAEQLRALALALATQINAAEVAHGEVADVGPEAICAIAASSAAESFGTTTEQLLAANRHRAVTDARAVAMTAARRGGVTLPAIASYFGKNHGTVIYSVNKVNSNPRLDAACNRIVEQLDQYYTAPTALDPVGGRSSTLQLAALDDRHQGTARRPEDDAAAQIAVAQTPGR